MVKKLLGIISLLTVLIALAACGNDTASSGEGEKETSEEPLKIFTTVYPLQFFAQQIAGDGASVESILAPGSDAHTYEPTTKEMIEIAEADAFLYNGAGLETYAQKISDSIKDEDVTILEATDGVELAEHAHDHDHGDDHDHGHSHGDQDPHVWLDPVRSIKMAENIKDTLVELRPEQEEVFEQNFEELKGQLESLDEEFRTQIDSLPENKIIVSHAAYGYWEDLYGIKQIAVSGLSPTNEPSQKDLQGIVETAEKYGLNYVLFEQNITPKVADVVREEIDAETLRIHNLATLTEEDIDNGEDYFSLMEKNLDVLTKALSEKSDVDIEVEEEHGHDHDHALSEEEQKIYDGYFEDSQVKDRPLSDWAGDWQSVYPYLQDGTLDEVFAHKAEDEGDKTEAEYKEYYETGYKTNVDRIIMEEDGSVTFFEDGEEKSAMYSYDGYEILEYEGGNRGVRYIFKKEDGSEGMPAYFQFSDHSIEPTDAGHYHLYWGDDREALLEEVTNWPTYYPSDMDGEEIAHEMMAH
ncbi:ZinT/AdcA family metal-binding protein [Halobacillus sp. ACCC02827]|uniref:metal ABC transporter solute-binding protein, Zn/Mn family n=1 Tax=Halobacillus sp. ACCC02827 TaxID=3052090 RepID=UPI0025700EBE|nr:ZinT/AdcA family metal-binding protein [Halobacillus sp. ACCC02827]WJE15013.1 ZinT/AdcA family metal-binding protein [Halobacillus sp. ACCC02827]